MKHATNPIASLGKWLAGFALLMLPISAQAQEWTVGDQGANWNIPSTFPTGSAPADAYEPADVPLPEGITESDWLNENGDQLQLWDIDDPVIGNFLVGVDAEAKALREKKIRITCEIAPPARRKDNILGKGIASYGHPHIGTGAVEWDENSDYTSLRTNPVSTCAGGPLNATNYMEPALLTTAPSGATVSMLPQSQAFYYTEGEQDDPNSATWLRRGMQFLLSVNPKDYNDTRRRAIYDAAGFEYPGSPDTAAGFWGWYCQVDGVNVTVSRTASRMRTATGAQETDVARHLKAEDGSDPWGGACTGTAENPAEMTAQMGAPGCWDRYNLAAPDGRGHFWYSARKGDDSVRGACPTTTGGQGYAHVPTLEVKNIYETTGFADYGNWYLSSDRMRMATTECPDAASPCDGVTGGNVPATVDGVFYSRVSKDPCRATGLDFCNGSTLHADYTFGWKGDVFDQMERECLGIPVRGIDPVDGPAECNASQVDRYHVLQYGTSPDPAWTGGCTDILHCHDSSPGNPERYAIIPGEAAGDVTIEHHH